MEISTKRIYDPASTEDGLRVLADRLWPRGIKKDDAKIDIWAKAVAPSNELRKWLHEHRDSYGQFKADYLDELNQNPDTRAFIEKIGQSQHATLLTSAKDVDHSHIPVLKEFISGCIK